MNIPLALDYLPDKRAELDNNNLIAIGRLSKEKGFIDLIDVIKLLYEQKNDIKLHIIGDGFEKQSIEQHIKECNLEGVVILHGFREKDYIRQILNDSSIYLMTSFTEAFPIVLMEAISFGLPIVAFNTNNGPLEIIEQGKNGFCIENRNKHEMADKVVMVLENIELRNKMGKAAYDKSKIYSVENVRNIWIDFLKNI